MGLNSTLFSSAKQEKSLTITSIYKAERVCYITRDIDLGKLQTM